MSLITLPKLSQTGANEWADVEDNDKAIRDVVNGDLDNTNLSGSAGITDANLASPNNSVYRTVMEARNYLGGLAIAAGTYLLGTDAPTKSGDSISSLFTSLPVPLFISDSTDYAVAGKTTKLRVRGIIATNGTAPGINFTFGLYPIISSAGASDEHSLTVGTVVSGSTVALNTPNAFAIPNGTSTDFTMPANTTAYVLAVVTSGLLTTGAVVSTQAQLQVRNV